MIVLAGLGQIAEFTEWQIFGSELGQLHSRHYQQLINHTGGMNNNELVPGNNAR